MNTNAKLTRIAFAGIAALALSAALVGCGGAGSGSSSSSDAAGSDETAQQEQAEPAVDLSGEWDYAIEVSTESVYGTIVSSENALVFELDGGNVTITAEQDGFSDDAGTYSVSGDTVTFELGGAGTVAGTLVDEETIELPGASFGVDGTMTLIKY